MDYDVIVVGSGAGALTGAYTAASAGLRTLVLEKAQVYGGTSAYSGGALFLPGNPVTVATGKPDSVERGRTYLTALLGDADALRREAFLETGPELVAFLTEAPELTLVPAPMPEYYDAPGRLTGGGQVTVELLPATELGDLEQLVRQGTGADRWGTTQPREMLWGGQALIGRLLMALARTGNAELRLGVTVTGLLEEDGRVVGVSADGQEFRASRGVLLASGGFERNAELRARFGVPGSAAHTMAPRETNTGEPIEAAIALGAATDHLDQAWFCPALVEPDGSAGFFLGLTGGLIVNEKGERFANESKPYDQFGREMAALSPTAWFVFDSRNKGRLPAVRCVSGPRRQDYLDAGAWVEAESLAELADLIGAPALVETVERFNGFAADGVDADFGRGTDEWDRSWVQPEQSCLVPVENPPYLAAKVVLGDLGTKGGLLTDANAAVVRADGSVIPGLYAAGNTMASFSGAVYPAPGTPIGSAMVFAYRAARHLAQLPST